MTNIVDFVTRLSEDLNKSEQCRAIKTKLIHSKQADQGKALEEAIQQLRGEVTATDRKCLELISNWQLIQVLCAGATGHLPDLDAAIFKSPVRGFMLRDATPAPEVDRSLKETFTPAGHDPKLYWLAEQFRRSFAPAERDFLMTASEETISKTHNLPANMTAIQLLKYGLPATIASGYSEGLGELHDRMMESRSASKSLFQQPPLKESRYFHQIDGRTADHPDHPFNHAARMKLPIIGGESAAPLGGELLAKHLETTLSEEPLVKIDIPETVEDQIVLPQPLIAKIIARGGVITARGIIYPKQVASSPEEELMMRTLDQAHEGYLKDFRRMVEKGYGAIRGENCLVVRRLEVLDPLRLLQVLQQSPVVIVGGQDLEFMIHDTPTLRHQLVEDEKRYSNRPMGRINGTLITISSEIPEGGEGTFLYAISELRERIR